MAGPGKQTAAGGSVDGRAKRPDIDWAEVERHYTAGLLSIPSIAKLVDCSHEAVRKRAKAEGWVRDLHGELKSRAERQAINEDVGVDPRKAELSEDEAEKAAEVVAGVLRKHKAASDEVISGARALLAAAMAVDDEGKPLLEPKVRSQLVRDASVAIAKAAPLERLSHGLDVHHDASAPNSVKIEVGRRADAPTSDETSEPEANQTGPPYTTAADRMSDTYTLDREYQQ